MFKKRIAVFVCLALILLCAAALADAAINEDNFPDANFRNAVSNFDLNKDNFLDRGEIFEVKKIYVQDLHIRDLKGIEFFSELDDLDCSNNEISSLDLSQNTRLTSLVCTNNQLSTLNLTQNFAVVQIYCFANQLESINLGLNTELRILSCAENKLTSLNLKYCGNLEELDCTDNQLKSLDLSGKKSLVRLACYKNELTQLNVKGCSSLSGFTCNNNQLTSLDVSDCPALKFLGCDYNRISSLKLAQHSMLDTLYCYNNDFTELDVRGCPILCGYMSQYQREQVPGPHDRFGEIFAFDCKVTVIGNYTSLPLGNGLAIDASNFPDDAFRAIVETFDQNKDHLLSDAEIAAVKTINCVNRGIVSLKGVEYFTALEELRCSRNKKLTSPNLSQNTPLTHLDIDHCPIKILDVTKLSKLTVLNCSSAKLTSLNISKNPKLTSLDVSANAIHSLNLSKNPLLKNLYCNDCPLSKLDLSKCTQLDILSCWNNHFTALDVRSCPLLCKSMNVWKRTYNSKNGYDYFGNKIKIGSKYKLIGDYESIHGKEPTRITAKNGLYSLSKSGAALLKPMYSSLTRLIIADEVQANGKTYRVIGINSNACKGMSKLTEVIVGKYVMTIGKNAFNSCKALKTVKGCASVSTIGDGAFTYCEKLAVFPQLNKLKKIGNAAFGKCISLEKFYLGALVNSIGKSAFQYCESLKSITIKTIKLTKKNVGKNAFYRIFKKAVFKCPKGKAKAYAELLRACGAPPTAIFR